MNATAIACQIRAYAVIAMIEGMKAENEFSVSCGNGIRYGEEAFYNAQADLERLAQECLEWGWQQ